MPGIFQITTALILSLLIISFSLIHDFDTSYENRESESATIRPDQDHPLENLIRNSEIFLLKQSIINEKLRRFKHSEVESFNETAKRLAEESSLTPYELIKHRYILYHQFTLNSQDYSVFYEDVMEKIPHGWPLKKDTLRINSDYGWRKKPFFFQKEKQFHKGLDLKAEIGEKVFSAAEGIVKTASLDAGGYGKLIIIEHPSGFRTYYAHLNKIYVKKNQILKTGSLIGLSGNSGYSTGPHLHYEIRNQNSHINPADFLAF